MIVKSLQHRHVVLRCVWILALTGCVTQAPAMVVPPTPSRVPGPTPTRVPAWADLSPYRAAMRPEFADDVEQFGQATQYRIDLSVDPSLTTITGTQTVHYLNTETVPLTEVYFRLFPNTPSYAGHVTVTLALANGAAVNPQMELADSAMRFPQNPPLRPGDAIDFRFDYIVTAPTQSAYDSYNQFGYFSRILALANVFPIAAVYDHEGWNVELASPHGDPVYSDTSLFQVTIRAPADQVVATSGTCQVGQPAGGTRVWRCVSGPMRDFMIVMSADYVVDTGEVDGIRVNAYSVRQKQPSESGSRAVRYTSSALRAYENRIGPYPFNEMDIVETPTSALGIEYPGLVVLSRDIWIYATYQESVAAHEVAHQWWYSLVGNDQLDDPWLDEGLAQFMTVLYYRDVYGQAAAQRLIDEDLIRRYERVQGTEADKRADLPVVDYTGAQYSSLVYGKAALFFKALDDKMGDDAFTAFLHDYFNANRYGNAHADDLLRALAAHIDPGSLEAIERQWLTTP